MSASGLGIDLKGVETLNYHILEDEGGSYKNKGSHDSAVYSAEAHFEKRGI